MRTNNLIENSKYNRAAIMQLAWRYAKGLFNGNVAKGMKAAWRSAKLEMDDVTIDITNVKPNPYTIMSDLYNSTNMRNGYATR